jgi:hypothetical protein
MSDTPVTDAIELAYWDLEANARDVFEEMREMEVRLAAEHARAAKLAAFSVWYAIAWERDPYECDETDIARMWAKFRDEWLPSLNEEHCGDCTNLPISCTRCHTEAYVKYGEMVEKVAREGSK